MDFTAAILKLAIMINYSTNPNSDLRDVCEQNGTAHGEFRGERTCCHKLYAEK